MNLCYLSLGSNLNSPERQIRLALHALRKLPYSYILKVASFYFSKAWGKKVNSNYCNTVVELQTSLSPFQLLDACQTIEKAQGRIRRGRWESRTLDIDILYYGNRKIDHPKLIIPHPRIAHRDFVFVPLREISKFKIEPLHSQSFILKKINK